ncbi:hypothetical protein [Candidatus Endomicrobiellum agilis]|jgi:DNA polymerase/3'-5' exonuclease PolX|uniref:hypothetical protein n=1 Tax=Candidatus Endomicrobiellum agilis TaxID=3238957 RepID=UPI0035868B32|nr:hypothetical protein [Endomicrobium sp.]
MRTKENNVKSGKEILDDFFQNISSIKGVDDKIANILSELYKTGKFTEKNITNKIDEIRQENDN